MFISRIAMAGAIALAVAGCNKKEVSARRRGPPSREMGLIWG